MPVIGEILADLAIKGKTKYDIDFLSLNRFSRANNNEVYSLNDRFAKL